MSKDEETRSTNELLAAMLEELRYANKRGDEDSARWSEQRAANAEIEARGKESHDAVMLHLQQQRERHELLKRADELNLKELERREAEAERFAREGFGGLRKAVNELQAAVGGDGKPDDE